MVRTGMKSSLAWMTETGNSYPAALNPCHTLSTALTGERLRDSPLASHDQIFSLSDRSEDRASHGSNRIPYVLKKVRISRATCDLALSSWKMAFRKPLKHDTVTGCKTLEIYRSAIIIPSI